MFKELGIRGLMICCFLVMFSLGNNCRPAARALIPIMADGFTNIAKVVVRSDEGVIKFSKSKDDVTRVYATGPDAARALIRQDGNVLNIENRCGSWSFGFSRNANFVIELGRCLLPEANLSLGSGKVKIKAAVKNLKINAGKLELYAEDLTGNTDIDTGSGILTLVHKVFKPVSYNIKAGSVQVTSLLSHGYRSICNRITGGNVQLKESSLPIRCDDADFSLTGKVGSANLFFRNLD